MVSGRDHIKANWTSVMPISTSRVRAAVSAQVMRGVTTWLGNCKFPTRFPDGAIVYRR